MTEQTPEQTTPPSEVPEYPPEVDPNAFKPDAPFDQEKEQQKYDGGEIPHEGEVEEAEVEVEVEES